MSIDTTLFRLEQAGFINVFDRKLGLFMQQLTSESDELVLVSVVLTSQAVMQGHVCLDLSATASRVFRDDEGIIFKLPPVEQWVSYLRDSILVGQSDVGVPVVIENDKLFLQKYYVNEKLLGEMVSARLGQFASRAISLRVVSLLDRLFLQTSETDWQRVAAVTALLQKFCIITGGPGTGKTTTVVKILALLLQDNPGLRISMAAPTGKAAARLQDSIKAARAGLNCDDAIRNIIPETAVTVHRLLGWMPDGRGFRHNRLNPLDLDVLIVDEVSMIDMLLMARLVVAVPADARIIFLGDPDQLSSVEAGSVLAELTRSTDKFSADFHAQLEPLVQNLPISGVEETSLLSDVVVALRKSHRFTRDSGLGRFSQAVNNGDMGTALALALDDAVSDVQVNWSLNPQILLNEIVSDAVVSYRAYGESVKSGKDKVEIFSAFEAYRILCAHRVGIIGADEINRLIEVAMFSEREHSKEAWYAGRPVMVSSNMPEQGLYNGDVGICLESKQHAGGLAVYFPQGDGRFRAYATPRLAAVATVFAMTIHKSQGSEFDRVGLVLGSGGESGLTRELIYTGVTRAKSGVCLYGTGEAFESGLSRRVQRYSALRQRIESRPA